MAPVIVIGPLFGTRHLLPVYRPLLSGDSEPPAGERFFPVPDMGLGHHQSMYDRLESQVLKLYEKLQKRLVGVGHSLGGLMLTKLAANNPEIFSDAICLAGAQEGIEHDTPGSLALARVLGQPPGRKLLQHDSPHMTQHREAIATRWSSDVGLHLIGSPVDDLLLPPQGLGLELPEGQMPERRIVGPPGTAWLLGRITDLPEGTKTLRSGPFLIDHYSIPLNPSVIQYTQSVRKAAVAQAEIAEIGGLPGSLQAVPAAA